MRAHLVLIATVAAACGRAAEPSHSKAAAEPPPRMPYAGAVPTAVPTAVPAAAAPEAWDEEVAAEPPAEPRPAARQDAGSAPRDRAEPQQQQQQPVKEQAPKQQRMVHYNGFVRVKVTQPQQALEQAAILADQLGGYIEGRSGNTITVRVPVARVREAFDALLKIGDVLARSLTAQDVTDAFTAAELRLKTMRASRDRLVELLARARTEHEKLALLQEIQRLTEQIDQLELQVKTLAGLASYSRLTLEAVPKQAHSGGHVEELAAFRWIHDLSPFRRDVAHRGDTLELTAPPGMVVLDDREHWIAESADGAVVWSSARDNEPKGTTEFWVEALKKRLGAEYGNAEIVKIGRYQFVRVQDTSEKAYRYLVGVLADGGDLKLVEIYYPTPAHEERHDRAVREALERGES